MYCSPTMRFCGNWENGVDKRCDERYNLSCVCGRSSSGRARPCQGRGSEFEPRRPLQKETPSVRMVFSFWNAAGRVELAASTSAKRVKSGGEGRAPANGSAIRGMPGSEFEPRRPLQKHHPKGGVFFADSALTAVSGRHKITSQNHSAGGPPLHRQFPLFLEGFCVDITTWKSLWKLCKTQ